MIARLKRLVVRALQRGGFRKPPFFIRDNPELSFIRAGEYSYGKPLVMGFDGTAETQVTIGKFCSFADGVRMLLRVNHPIDAPSTYPLPLIFGESMEKPYEWSRGPIAIGSDVWVGMDAVLLGGITIGDGAVIAAHAVVTKDVPPYAIVAGNPARVVRYRFSEPVIQQLRDISWWDWPIERIKSQSVALATGDVQRLIDECGSENERPR